MYRDDDLGTARSEITRLEAALTTALAERDHARLDLRRSHISLRPPSRIRLVVDWLVTLALRLAVVAALLSIVLVRSVETPHRPPAPPAPASIVAPAVPAPPAPLRSLEKAVLCSIDSEPRGAIVTLGQHGAPRTVLGTTPLVIPRATLISQLQPIDTTLELVVDDQPVASLPVSWWRDYHLCDAVLVAQS